MKKIKTWLRKDDHDKQLLKMICAFLFPIIVSIVVILLVPDAAPLVGMLMLGNLFKETGVVDRLSKTAQNELINIVTIFLALTVGATATANTFLSLDTIKIVALGLFAFCFSTVGGLLFGKLMCKLTGGKVSSSSHKIPFVIFSDDKRYWSIFEPICKEMDKRGVL